MSIYVIMKRDEEGNMCSPCAFVNLEVAEEFVERMNRMGKGKETWGIVETLVVDSK